MGLGHQRYMLDVTELYDEVFSQGTFLRRIPRYEQFKSIVMGHFGQFPNFRLLIFVLTP